MEYFPPRTTHQLLEKGIFTLTGHITEETAQELCRNMMEYTAVVESVEEITLLISSPGGSLDAAMGFSEFVALFDEVNIRGIALGECESAALMILQCCHTRTSMRNCAFLIHHIHTLMPTTYDGTEKLQVEAFIKDGRRASKKMTELICRRSGLTKNEWRRLADEGERYMTRRTAEELKELGLLDEIIDALPLF